jgi:nucleotide-binding universal stress UspA family protein
MFREILVPLDGSAHSEHALPLAAALADLSGGRLTLVRVHTPAARVPPRDDGLEGLPGVREADTLAVEGARRYLEGLSGDIAPELVGHAVRTTVLVGAVADELLRYAREASIDLVVMTTHGRGAVGRAWLGSIADRLIRRARIPILLRRPGDVPGVLRSVPLWKHVLVPLDGSDIAAQILAPALALARLTHARITLLRVVDRTLLTFGYPPVPHGVVLESPAAANDEAIAHAALEAIAASLRAEGLHVDTSVVAHPRPAEAILQSAEALDADLIALSTRGRGGVSRVLLGSVADKVLRAAPVPVLVQRPGPVTPGQASATAAIEVVAGS